MYFFYCFVILPPHKLLISLTIQVHTNIVFVQLLQKNLTKKKSEFSEDRRNLDFFPQSFIPFWYTSNLYLTLNYRASCFNMLINRDATLLISCTCFGLSPVHHQEHHLINCITHWYVRAH